MRVVLALGGSALAFAIAIVGAGCGSKSSTSSATDGGLEGLDAATTPDAACPDGQIACHGGCIDATHDDANCGACDLACEGPQHCVASTCQVAKIEHVVLIVQENHTFDAYFGRYCHALAYANPTCTAGRDCCEGAPDLEPRGASPKVLDDITNFGTDRNHDQVCELQQIHGGAMDGFVTGSTGTSTCLGSGPSCSSPDNWVIANEATVGDYWKLADANALADRYFQPIAGGTASNNMYFAVAHQEFIDNDLLPTGIGTPHGCLQGACYDGTPTSLQGETTIADLLLAHGKTFTVYADGIAHARAAAPSCESIPADCPYDSIAHPIAAQACKFDLSDIPFAYYDQFGDGAHFEDWTALADDLATGKLATFSYVKAREFHNEHPNVSTITDGIAFVKTTLDLVQKSPYAASTLVLLTWDEGGGFFDHVPPPPSVDVDPKGAPVPHGTRVPLLAIGPFAAKGKVSHVTMQHASVVRFLEYVFLGPVGQLGHADAKVNGLGSLLDPATTGIPIP